ncbi:SlyX family protein [Roseimaritima sediminicola]|uniref:SlyX family protein n=1 Tax=Roseimaritima sediminicola TaxID=2662066 RepID=UPI001386C9E7|nr:SlyX family protein [Roseimaritima sediminicola]
MDASERLTEIEIQLTHQQRFTEQLNEVIAEQYRMIEALERKVVGLETQVRRLRDTPPEQTDLADEKPPHY